MRPTLYGLKIAKKIVKQKVLRHEKYKYFIITGLDMNAIFNCFF
jgi:hypothetical protein